MNHTVFPSALSPQNWPFTLDWLPHPAYLVGGGVRDALQERISTYLDLDFVLPQRPVETAQAIAQHYRAGFVLLDKERQIARVVFEQATVDFALQVGPDLTTDLQRRDFTINAIAYDPHDEHIIDPLQGCADLKRRVIRMVAPQNLAEDPLRLLRAYRQAAQLNFTLDEETQQHICRLAPLLETVAAERVRVELSYLLSHPTGTAMLTAAWKDQLLQFWFPGATAVGLGQIAAMDQAVADLIILWPELQRLLERGLSEQARGGEAARRTLLATTKLMGLITTSSLAIATEELQRLKYSRAEINLVLTLLKHLLQLPAAPAQLSRQDQYFLFQAVGRAFPALVALAVARGTPILAIAPLVKRYLDPSDAIAHPTPLVTGKDLISQLQLQPGPQIGKILAAIELAQAKGEIHSTAAALKLAIALSSTNDPDF